MTRFFKGQSQTDQYTLIEQSVDYQNCQVHYNNNNHVFRDTYTKYSFKSFYKHNLENNIQHCIMQKLQEINKIMQRIVNTAYCFSLIK